MVNPFAVARTESGRPLDIDFSFQRSQWNPIKRSLVQRQQVLPVLERWQISASDRQRAAPVFQRTRQSFPARVIALIKNCQESFPGKVSPARVPDFLGISESIGLRSMSAQPFFKIARYIVKCLPM